MAINQILFTFIWVFFMQRGGKREGAGRKCEEPTVRLNIPLSLEPLFRELIKITRGTDKPYSSYLALVLVARTFGIPSIFDNYAKRARREGLYLVNKLIEVLEPRIQKENCPASVTRQLAELVSVRELFKTQPGETLSDIRESSK